MSLSSWKAGLSSRLQTWITKASKLLQVDLKYILHGGSWLSLTQISSAVVGFVMSIGFANLLSQESYGTYRYLLSAYSLIAILALPGIDTAIIQSLGKGFESSYPRGIRLKFIWSLLGSLTCFGLGIYYFIRHDQVMAILFGLCGVFLPLMEVFALSATYFNAKKQFRPWALLDVFSQIVTTAVLLLTIFLSKRIEVLIIAYFVSNIVMRGVSFFYTRRTSPPIDPAAPIDTGLSSYARSLSVFQLTSRIISSIDGIILFHFLGPVQLAIFSIAQAIPMRIQSVLRILGTLAFPKFANRTSHEIAKVLPKKMLILGAGILGICVVYWAAAPLFFRMFFPKYLASVPYSQLFALTMLSAVTYPVGSFLFVHKRIKENYLLSWSSLLIKIVCLAIFVPRVGIWGAVISAIASSASTTILSFALLIREKQLPVSS